MLTEQGYIGKILRVNLADGEISQEDLNEIDANKYLGGTGLGAKYLYAEVPPNICWADPENRLIFASGPVSGTIRGGGTISLITKGPMTNGAVSSQAGGFMAAYMKFSGFDAIIIQGCAPEWVYLYVHDGLAELRDAKHLLGQDTWKTKEFIMKELGKSERDISVFCIGPAGENKVRFASIVGDHGHVIAHGGNGAVMGSKNLKAVVVGSRKPVINIFDKEALLKLERDIFREIRPTANCQENSTTQCFSTAEGAGWLPIRNYTAKSFPNPEKFECLTYRPHYDVKIQPCWRCNFKHCSMLKIKNGPYAGFEGEEPEYEGLAAFGSQIMVTNLDAAIVLSNQVDGYGFDINEAGWIMGWVMECYEKGLLTLKDLDNLDLKWGNVVATQEMLRKIAYRDGFGDILAEGVRLATTKIDGEARSLAIFTEKGNVPRGHDHRIMWQMILDVCTSNTGTDQASLTIRTPESLGLPKDTDPFTPEAAADMLLAGEGQMTLEDSMVICKNTLVGLPFTKRLDILNAVTGYGYDRSEALNLTRRIVNLLKVFNIRCGHTAALDRPSVRYASDPQYKAGAGKSFYPVFDKALRRYYKGMGWDQETGKPLPGTLKSLGLENVIKDIWNESEIFKAV